MNRLNKEEEGIALITTLIMLSLVTFLSVAFLTLTRQERQTVTVLSDIVTAEEMERTAMDRAVGEVMTRMLMTNGPNSRQVYDFMVSTNYERNGGFLSGVASLANVKYSDNNGDPLNPGDQRRNIGNLYFDPRVPVYRDVNHDGRIDPREDGQEFIYYIDFNRNGQFEPSGWVPNTNNLGQPLTPSPVHRMGDPQWIGVLDRPDLWHQGTNRFLGRYAYLVMPTSRSLDLNYIHNQARLINQPHNAADEGYVRNQGAGNWELNLAAFLVELNRSAWNPTAAPYAYDPFLINGGDAFNHARDLSRARYQFLPTDNQHFINLWTYNQQFLSQGTPNGNFFWGLNHPVDFPDFHGNGPLHVGPSLKLGLTAANGSFGGSDDRNLVNAAGANASWFGSPMPSPFFDVTELLRDSAPLPVYSAFASRLRARMVNAGHYDRYTFYRMLAQMGTDSGEPFTNKIHLNFKNWQPTNTVHLASDRTRITNDQNYLQPLSFKDTEFDPWVETNASVAFPALNFWEMTNHMFGLVADTLLRKRFGLSFKDTRANNQNLASTIAIPVWRSDYGSNVYRSDIHQTLQLAANIYDATTGAQYPEWNASTNNAGLYIAGGRVLRNGLIYEAVSNSSGSIVPEQDSMNWQLIPHAPSIFRPQFDVITDGMNEVLRVQITNYVQEMDTNFLGRTWLDMNVAAHRDFLRDELQSGNPSAPNFNLYGVPLVVGAKKGLPNFNEFGLLSRVTVGRKIEIVKTRGSGTNANNYRTNLMYTLGITNQIAAEAWNSYTQAYPNTVKIVLRHDVLGQITNSAGTVLTNFVQPTTFVQYTNNAGNWPGVAIIPLAARTRTLLGASHYLTNNDPSFVPIGALPSNRLFDRSGQQVFESPDWHLTATHRLAFWMIDTNLNKVIDVVSLNDLTSHFDLTRELLDRTSLSGLWETNRPGGTNDFRVPTFGVLEQLAYAGGYRGISSDEWDAFPNQTPTAEQAFSFRSFFNRQDSRTNMQAPFEALRSLVSRHSWAANDPLVHYTREDLTDLNRPVEVEVLEPPQTPTVTNRFFGINERYSPWGGKRRPGDLFVTDGGSQTNTVGTNTFVNPGASQSPEHIAYNLALKDPGIRWSDDWNFPTHRFGNIGWLGRIHRGTPWQTVYLKAHIAPTTPPTGLPDYSWARWAGRNNTHPTNDWELLDLFTAAPSPNAARGLMSINQTNDAAWYAALSGLLVLSNVVDDLSIGPTNANILGWLTLDANPANGAIRRIVDGIRRERDRQPNGMFTNLGQILAVEELSVGGSSVNNPVSPTNFSPVLNRGFAVNTYYSGQEIYGIPDAAYERLPQQLMSLLKVEDHPRLTVYSWGQALKPARRSVVLTAGAYRGMCTNYQVTAEVASKSVLRLEGVNPRFGFHGTNNVNLATDRISINRIAFRLRHSQRALGQINGTPVRIYAGAAGVSLPEYEYIRDPDEDGPLPPATTVTTERFIPGQIYYIMNARPDDFQIGVTPKGPVVNLTAYGSGVAVIETVPKAVVESHTLLYPE